MKPVIRVLDLNGLTPLQVFRGAPASWKHLAFLASSGTPESRWSVLSWSPAKSVISGKDLATEMRRRKADQYQELPFIGGAIGTMDYEGAVEFAFYDSALVYDHHEKKWWGINVTGEDVPCCRDAINRVSTLGKHSRLELHPLWNFEQYQKAFQIVHDNIRRGEIYQACLTFPFTGPLVSDTRQLFAMLYGKNPAPMAAYLEQSGRTVMSFSPERFISWDGKMLETKPIKGTRPRGDTVEEDERMKHELLADEKEQAELSMITDLLRNDLARVSKPGTVQVLNDHVLQATPNVWHTFSHIRSETKKGISAWDILQSMFPGGSISGCPKIRALEILRDVEQQPRGIYTGCIGYISDHGTMDMNIAIRTLEQNSKEIRAGFGSGIVYDSQAKAEYQECFDKAKLFLDL